MVIWSLAGAIILLFVACSVMVEATKEQEYEVALLAIIPFVFSILMFVAIFR